MPIQLFSNVLKPTMLQKWQHVSMDKPALIEILDSFLDFQIRADIKTSQSDPVFIVVDIV